MAGYPRIEPRKAAADDQFEFSAVFEVYPEIKLGDLSAITIVATRRRGDAGRRRPDDRDSAQAERALRDASQDRRVTGDRALVDFTGTIDGVEFPGGQAKDFPIVLGEGRMLPEFETALDGMTAGETKIFPLTFPADYHGKEVAGKTAEFTLTLQSVSEPKLPVVDADFARQVRHRQRQHR